MKREAWFAFIVLFVAGIAAVYVGNNQAVEAADTPVGVSIGMQAPDFTLPDLNGNPVSLSELRGKPVIINFWASWCPPCREEMPEMQTFHEMHHGRVTVLGVNLAETPEKVTGFLDEYGYKWPMVLDRGGDIRELYRVRVIPTTYFLDGKGIIHRVYAGPLTLDMMMQFSRGLR